MTLLVQKVPRESVGRAAGRTRIAVLGTGITLAASVPLVRVFLNSSENAAGLDAMPVELATAGAAALGGLWPAFAPVVGALGSFVSGSATFSHLMFAQLQSDVATQIGAQPNVVLAQQVAVQGLHLALGLRTAAAVVNHAGGAPAFDLQVQLGGDTPPGLAFVFFNDRADAARDREAASIAEVEALLAAG